MRLPEVDLPPVLLRFAVRRPAAAAGVHEGVGVAGRVLGAPLRGQATFTAEVNAPGCYRHVRAVKTVAEYFFIGHLRVFGEPVPTIASLPASDHPPAPPGMLMVCCPGPESGLSLQCPVLQWSEITYWPYSFGDNRYAMGIVGYDRAGNIRRSVEVPGARYVWKITVDPDARTVTFWGQSNFKAVASWAALAVS